LSNKNESDTVLKFKNLLDLSRPDRVMHVYTMLEMVISSRS